MALRMPDYWCDACAGRFEIGVVETPVPENAPCPRCGGEGYHVIGAPKIKTVWGCAAQRGKPEPPPHKNALDTSLLGEGMPVQEFYAKRKKLREEQRHARIKKAADAVWQL